MKRLVRIILLIILGEEMVILSFYKERILEVYWMHSIGSYLWDERTKYLGGS